MTTTIERPSGAVRYVIPGSVFATLRTGGSISVEEWPGGQMPEVSGEAGVILLQVEQDVVGGAPSDTVSMHRDEPDRLDLFDRAIKALENARAALLATGYRDYSTIVKEGDDA